MFCCFCLFVAIFAFHTSQVISDPFIAYLQLCKNLKSCCLRTGQNQMKLSCKSGDKSGFLPEIIAHYWMYVWYVVLLAVFLSSWQGYLLMIMHLLLLTSVAKSQYLCLCETYIWKMSDNRFWEQVICRALQDWMDFHFDSFYSFCSWLHAVVCSWILKLCHNCYSFVPDFLPLLYVCQSRTLDVF